MYTWIYGLLLSGLGPAPAIQPASTAIVPLPAQVQVAEDTYLVNDREIIRYGARFYTVAKLIGGEALVSLHGAQVKAVRLRATSDGYERLAIREIALR